MTKKIIPITTFFDNYRFLSNFFVNPVEFRGEIYRTAEHAYQAAKAVTEIERKLVKQAHTPAFAKRLGNQIRNRSDWKEVRLEVMEEIVRLKFTDVTLRAMLLTTGDAELIEGNTWHDQFWGMTVENGEWVGQNNLGKILMKVRSEIREERDCGK